LFFTGGRKKESSKNSTMDKDKKGDHYTDFIYYDPGFPLSGIDSKT
jgi:hypothetical protein